MSDEILQVFENASKLLQEALFPGKLAPVVNQCIELLDGLVAEGRAKKAEPKAEESHAEPA